MYDDSITTIGATELLTARLAQAEASLRGTPVVTREDLLATVYSALNSVLSLGNNTTPLLPVAREGPAIAGDLNGNFQLLNQDAQAIIRQLIGTENDAATLFNLFASTQNNLRQTIREAVYTSGSRRYVEEFISNTKLGACSATVDFNAGVAALPLVSETFLQPASIDFGVACVGDPTKLVGTTDLLLDGKTETSMTWIGARLELVFNFSKIQVLNRFRIELAGYQGLVVEEFSSSPDGVIREDLLADLQPSSLSLDGSSGKFNGDWIADFDPRHCKQVRLNYRRPGRHQHRAAQHPVLAAHGERLGTSAEPADYPAVGQRHVSCSAAYGGPVDGNCPPGVDRQRPLPVGDAGSGAGVGGALLVPGSAHANRCQL
jgi:hypothetical protein